MRYIDFQNSINKPFFRETDLSFRVLNISKIQLYRWVKDGYIKRVKIGLYVFENRKTDIDIRTISFFLYEPSYISLESALSYHGLIPEMVYSTTCITTRNTRTFNNMYGNFIYHHIRYDLLWGYDVITTSSGKYLMAEPEKAILDYIYLHQKELKDENGIYEWRINPFEFKDTIKISKLMEYLKYYESPNMNRIINLLIKNVNS